MIHSLAIAGLMLVANYSPENRGVAVFDSLQTYINQRQSEFNDIPDERKKQLDVFADYITSRVQSNKPVRINFICTHNSRRSHMGQIWAAVAANAYNVDSVHTYSGGTEATAFNPRAVAALRRAALTIKQTTTDENPIYHVTYSKHAMPITSFSKVYDHAPNPKHDFAAIMTCSSADKACPAVPGADQRFAITYEDPKAFDGTDKEAAMYDERCAQIARELLYAFSKVKK